MDRPVSVGVALITGLFWVHAPILFFFVGPLVVLALYNDTAVTVGRRVGLVFVCLTIGFTLGWTWWALTVPRWRVWTYRRVKNMRALRRWAIAVGLSLPDNGLIIINEAQAEMRVSQKREEERAARGRTLSDNKLAPRDL